MPAPARWPLRKAAVSAASSWMPPRAVVTKSAPRFIRANAAASIIFKVVRSRGQCSETTSERSSSSWKLTGAAPRRVISAGSSSGSVASTSIPKARASAATRVPTCPMPTMPSVLPRISWPITSSRPNPCSRRSRRSHSSIRRDTPSMSPNVCSATEAALPPAWLTTGMPACVQAATSTVS